MIISIGDWEKYVVHKCGYVGKRDCLDYSTYDIPCPECGEFSNNCLGWTKKVGRRIKHILTVEMEWKK